MSESGLWKYLRSHVHGVDWVRVENPVHPGTPDVNYAIDVTDHAVEGWVELKWVARFPRKSTKPVFGEKKGLNKNQITWIRRRARYGGRVWIVAGIGKAIYFLDGYTYVDQFNDMVTEDFARINTRFVLWRIGDEHFQTHVINLLRRASCRPFHLANDARLPPARVSARPKRTRRVRSQASVRSRA